MLEANLADRQVVQYVIRRFGIHAKHKLGQNFLIRPDVVAAIAEAAELGENVPVMEIGAGIGTLTQALAETGADVTAFELDKSLERVLSHTLEHYKNIHIIYEDVLKADLKTILGDKDWRCAANLPYYITTPILLSLIQSDLPISLFVFMMQKEVADRILARPGSKDYGALTIAVNFDCTAERVLDIPPSAFIPRPQVTSTVLKIRRREKPAVEVKDRKLFFSLVKMGFGQRRNPAAFLPTGYLKSWKKQILMAKGGAKLSPWKNTPAWQTPGMIRFMNKKNPERNLRGFLYGGLF